MDVFVVLVVGVVVEVVVGVKFKFKLKDFYCFFIKTRSTFSNPGSGQDPYNFPMNVYVMRCIKITVFRGFNDIQDERPLTNI